MTTTMAPEETLDRRSAAKIGSIVITRHGQPHADRTVRIDQDGYREWWKGYDLARLHPDEIAPARLVELASKADIINVVLCAHGWFNRMMRPVLKSQGWREVEDHGDRYWSYRRYEKIR
jgi:hypothetical protein